MCSGVSRQRRAVLERCAETSLNSKLLSGHKQFFAKARMRNDSARERPGLVAKGQLWRAVSPSQMVVDAVLSLEASLEMEMVGIKKQPGGSYLDSRVIRGVAFKKTFSYAGFEQQPKKFLNPKILLLNVELELKAEKENAEVRLENPDVSDAKKRPAFSVSPEVRASRGSGTTAQRCLAVHFLRTTSPSWTRNGISFTTNLTPSSKAARRSCCLNCRLVSAASGSWSVPSFRAETLDSAGWPVSKACFCTCVHLQATWRLSTSQRGAFSARGGSRRKTCVAQRRPRGPRFRAQFSA